MSRWTLTAHVAGIGGAKLIAFGLSVCLPLIIVRRLSPLDFGLYKQAFLVIGSATSLLPLGFAWNLMYFIPREPERQGAVVLNAVIFTVVVGLSGCFVCVLCPGLIVYICGSPLLGRYSASIGAVIALGIVSNILEIVALASQDLRKAAIFIVGIQLSKTFLMAVAVCLVGSVGSLICALGIHGLLQLGVLWKYLTVRFPNFWRQFDWQMMRAQVHYSLPVGAAALMSSIQTDFHSYFVSHRFGTAAFAIYAIGCFELPLVWMLLESVSAVTTPKISVLHKEGRAEDIIALTARGLRKLAAVYFPLYAVLIVIGREVIALVFTPRYIAAWPIFAVNLTLLPTYALMVEPIWRASADLRYFVLRLRLVLSALLLVALWFGTRWLGILGAILSMVMMVIADKLVTAVKVGYTLGVTWRDVGRVTDTAKLALASLIAALASSRVRAGTVAYGPFVVIGSCGIAFAIVYVAIVTLFEIPTAEERTTLLNLLYVLRIRRRPRLTAA